MTTVHFQLEPGKAPTHFRFGVDDALDLEEIAGCNPGLLAVRGQSVRALVLMVWFGTRHADPLMNRKKATRLVQRFLDGGGDIQALSEALAKAMNDSGIYGKPDAPHVNGDEGEETVVGPLAQTPATSGHE